MSGTSPSANRRTSRCSACARSMDRDYLCRGEQPLLAAEDLKIPGMHNRANALAALAMGTALGFDLSAMLEVLRVPRLPHRTQFVAEIKGVCWYNDSKGTNLGDR